MSELRFESLPQLEPSRVKLLWVNDWYDGPVEAVVEHDGERFLMLLHERGEVDVGQPMHWLLHRLSPDQWRDEEHWHSLFEEVVGHHWCFCHEPVAEPVSRRDPHDFYGPYEARPPRTLGAPHGWLDQVPTG